MEDGTMRVLVLEDDVVTSLDLEGMLGELGHEAVGPFRALPAAMAVVEAEPIDFALLDHSLGPTSSVPVARALKARGIPFAAVTGRQREDLPADLAAAPYLPKPVSRDALRAVLPA
jgi:DNA-binding response OmpR family regulator